jgi:hypothetical protein
VAGPPAAENLIPADLFCEFFHDFSSENPMSVTPPPPPPADTVSGMAALQVDLVAKLGTVVADSLIETAERFPENPALPYTLALTCLARTAGQVIGGFPDSQQKLLLDLAVRQMLQQAHAITADGNPHIQSEFGNA